MRQVAGQRACAGVRSRYQQQEEGEAQLKQFGIAMAVLLSAILNSPASAQTPQLVTEEMMVKSSDPGIEIYVRNKRPANMTSLDRKSTRLNSSHLGISYAVFCLKKKR